MTLQGSRDFSPRVLFRFHCGRVWSENSCKGTRFPVNPDVMMMVGILNKFFFFCFFVSCLINNNPVS